MPLGEMNSLPVAKTHVKGPHGVSAVPVPFRVNPTPPLAGKNGTPLSDNDPRGPAGLFSVTDCNTPAELALNENWKGPKFWVNA